MMPLKAQPISEYYASKFIAFPDPEASNNGKNLPQRRSNVSRPMTSGGGSFGEPTARRFNDIVWTWNNLHIVNSQGKEPRSPHE